MIPFGRGRAAAAATAANAASAASSSSSSLTTFAASTALVMRRRCGLVVHRDAPSAALAAAAAKSASRLYCSFTRRGAPTSVTCGVSSSASHLCLLRRRRHCVATGGSSLPYRWATTMTEAATTPTPTPTPTPTATTATITKDNQESLRHRHHHRQHLSHLQGQSQSRYREKHQRKQQYRPHSGHHKQNQSRSFRSDKLGNDSFVRDAKEGDAIMKDAGATTGTTLGAGAIATPVGESRRAKRTRVSASVMQRRIAAMTMERMTSSTERILSLRILVDDQNRDREATAATAALANEIRVALQYWTSRWYTHHHPAFTITPTVSACDETGADYAELLLDWIDKYGRAEIRSNNFGRGGGKDKGMGMGMGSDGAAVAGTTTTTMADAILGGKHGNQVFSDLVNARFLPCWAHDNNHDDGMAIGLGTHPTINNHSEQDENHREDMDSIDENIIHDTASTTSYSIPSYPSRSSSSSSTFHFTARVVRPETWIACIRRAVNVLNKMDRIHADTSNSVQPDSVSDATKMSLWYKVSTFLGSPKSAGIWMSRTTGATDTGAGGETSFSSSSSSKKTMREEVDEILRNAGLGGALRAEDAISKMEDILTEMESKCRRAQAMESSLDNNDGDDNDDDADRTKLRAFHYNMVVGALSSSSMPDRAGRADMYLRRMERAEDIDLGLDRRGTDGSDGGGAFRADLHPPALAYPDTVTYNCVIHAYASSVPSLWKERIRCGIVVDGDEYEYGDGDGDGDKDVSFDSHRGRYNRRRHRLPLANTTTTNRRGNRGASHRAASVLRRLEHRYQSTGRKTVCPDVKSYASVLHAHANAGEAKEAERLLDRMRMGTGTCVVEPNLYCYNAVLGAYAKSGRSDAARNAEALLDYMERSSLSLSSSPSSSSSESSSPQIMLKPDTVSYGAVLAALSRSKDLPDAAERAESLLRRSLERYRSHGDVLARPDAVSWNTVLDAWAKRAGAEKDVAAAEGAARRAEALLGEMEDGSSIAASWPPSSLSLSSPHKPSDEHRVGTGVSNGGRDNRRVLDLRAENYSHNTVIGAWAKSRSAEAGDRAEALLRRLSEAYRRTGNVQLRPDEITYNSVLQAIARSRADGALDRASAFLRRMEEESVASAAAGGASSEEVGVVRPGSTMYNILLKAMCENHDWREGDPESAERFLRSMEERYASGELSFELTEVPYNIVIDGYAKSGKEGSAERAQRLLRHMTEVAHPSGRGGGIAPSAVTFNSVLNGLSKSTEPNKGERAEELVETMERMYREGNRRARPNVVTYATVIDCWARSDDPDAPERAESVLRRMEELAEKEEEEALALSGRRGKRRVDTDEPATTVAAIRPNAYVISAVMNAWVRSGSPHGPDRALAVLYRSERLHREGRSDTPNEICYCVAINAYAKSDAIEDKAARAYDVLKRMSDAYRGGNRGARPTVKSFCAVMNACAYTRGDREEKQRAFQVARMCLRDLMTMSDVVAGGGPNNIIFGDFLLACARLAPPGPERDSLAELVFRECCKLGQLDERVLQNLRQASSRGVYFALTGNRGVHELPNEWKCNATKRLKRR